MHLLREPVNTNILHYKYNYQEDYATSIFLINKLPFIVPRTTQWQNPTLNRNVADFQCSIDKQNDTITNTVPESIKMNWNLLSRAGLSERAYLYLLRLAKKESGWRGKGSRPLNGESLKNFLLFWSLIKEKAVEPDFVLHPNGNLQVEWFKNNHHCVDLEFRPDNLIIFGLFDGVKEIEGIENSDNIIGLLSRRNFKPLKWFHAV